MGVNGQSWRSESQGLGVLVRAASVPIDPGESAWTLLEILGETPYSLSDRNLNSLTSL